MKKDFPIQIGDKLYQLRYNFDALTKLEDLTNETFTKHVIQLGSGSMKSLKMLFFVGLSKNHPEITLENVVDILDDCPDVNALMTTVATGVGNFFSKDAKKKISQPEATLVSTLKTDD
jgi:hypothetical protein